MFSLCVSVKVCVLCVCVWNKYLKLRRLPPSLLSSVAVPRKQTRCSVAGIRGVKPLFTVYWCLNQPIRTNQMLRIQCSIRSLCWLPLFHVVTDNNGLKHKISSESSLILLLAVSGANVCTVFICSENKRHLRSFGQAARMYGGVSSLTEQTIFDLQNLKINTKWN